MNDKEVSRRKDGHAEPVPGQECRKYKDGIVVNSERDNSLKKKSEDYQLNNRQKNSPQQAQQRPPEL
jgi:hypothetical protein